MKIYTSYFAMVRHLPEELCKVSISLYSPPGFTGASLSVLAPSKQLLADYKQNKDERAYTERFHKQLQSLSVENIVHRLEQLSTGKDCVLLCYEKTENFCHRHLVAQWQRDAGYDVEEWRKEE